MDFIQVAAYIVLGIVCVWFFLKLVFFVIGVLFELGSAVFLLLISVLPYTLGALLFVVIGVLAVLFFLFVLGIILLLIFSG